MKIVLVGQPNSGKSTIFNWFSGYKSVTANFPGTTVHYTTAKARLNGWRAEVVDLPGIHSLAATDAAAAAALNYLFDNGKPAPDPDAAAEVLVNVVDATRLSHALTLTLQLLELGRPLVLCLNMIDEACYRGLRIDQSKLAAELGVPVVATVAAKAQGLPELFRQVRQAAQPQSPGRLPKKLPPCRQLKTAGAQPAADMAIAARRDRAKKIFESCTEIGKPKIGWRDRLDNVLMHPLWGYLLLVLILHAFFNLIFKIGAWLEPELLGIFEAGTAYLRQHLGENAFITTLLSGILQGLGAGVGIVLPYLVPFLLGMAFLEDFGYLPRVAFLMDGLMQRIGLHGASVFPAILGYGCSVPAVMATRILRSPRDRFVASILAVIVPCSARTTVILGLVAFYLSPNAALAIYALNILVIALCGKVLATIWPEITPGLVMEIPPYRVPTVKLLLAKTWWRLKEFVVIAWPLLIVGSIVLSLAEAWQLDHKINTVLSPLTHALGLPIAVGTTLIFGVMRKELSMLMLMQALGTTEVTLAMTPLQIVIFTLFVVFYIPCLATITVLWKEIGKRRTMLAMGLTFVLAVGISFLARVLFSLLRFP
jgi:ferrous iron transport protein B